MYSGEIVEFGEAIDIMGNPQHPYTKLLTSAVPDPQGALAATRGEIQVALADQGSNVREWYGCRTRIRVGAGISEHRRRPLGTSVEPGGNAGGDAA